MAVPLPRQRDEMAQPTYSAIFPVDIGDAADLPPPTNDSVEAQEDLVAVIAAMRKHGAATEFDVLADTDGIAPLVGYAERNGLYVPSGWPRSLAKAAIPFILRLKFRYNRPRPAALAFMYGRDLVPYGSKTADSPAYPSGHAFQAYLVAEVMARVYPAHRSGLLGVADAVAQSRINLGLHYPSDVAYGRALAQSIAHKVPFPT